MSITAVILENLSASAQASVPFTFGQVFKKGDVPAGSNIALQAPDSSTIPCQMNVHNAHADGSVKHASISLIVPNMGASASIPYSIVLAQTGPSGTPPVPAEYPALSASVRILDTGTEATGPLAGVVYNADLGLAIAAGKHKVHRTGPIMADWSVRVPFITSAGVEHPDLHARFYVLMYKGQARARIKVVIENTNGKPKAVMPSSGTPWETVSNAPRIYYYEVRIGGQIVDKRELSGFHHVLMTYNSSGTYPNFATGMPSDSNQYTFSVMIDGTRKNVSVAGSAVQTYGQLFTAITSQLGGLAKCDSFGNGGLRITSNSKGGNSSVVIDDYGTLLPGLLSTGLSSSTSAPVTYTASVSINGTVKPISVIGNQALTFAKLCAVINTQLGGLGTAIPQAAAPGFRIVNAQGTTENVVITDTNLVSKISSNGGNHLKPRRPMRGDEYLHFAYSFWKKTFWQGGEPSVHVRYDKAYWVGTHAYPNYKADLVGDTATIARNLATINADDIGMNGITKAYMGDTGYAPGIGILPEWAAMYIVNQGRDTKFTMLKQADLQGSWSMHVRETVTDGPLSFVKWPCATFSPSASDSKNSITGLQEKLPSISQPSHLPTNNNKPDVAHHPDFSYVPYLITGDLDYLEALLMHFNYTILDMNAATSYRTQGKCLFKGQSQVRAQAWSFRTIVHTLFAIPDNHPLKPEIAQILANNVQWYNGYYVDPNGAGHNVFGLFGGIIYSRNGASRNSFAPWQEDFATQAIGRGIELGFKELLPLLKYKSAQIKGRMTSGPDFCYFLATNYTLQCRDTETSPLYTSWKEVYNKGFSAAITSAACGTPEFFTAIGEKGMSGYPTEISGFPSNMQPAAAYTATYKMESCEDAWLIFENRALKPDYNKGPQFAIEPRVLTEAEIPNLAPVDIIRSGIDGLGGVISGISVGTALYDNVNPGETAETRTEYRCVYVKNQYPDKTIYDAVLWITANTPSAGTTIEAGLGTSALNGVEQTVANETTAPNGVNFTLAATKAAGVKLGDLAPNATRAVWFKRVSNAGTTPAQSDGINYSVEGSIDQ